MNSPGTLRIVATRGDLIESAHDVSVAVARSDGRTVAHAGDPDLATFWRSAAKPFQALPLLEEPLSLLDPPIAFSWWPCSSSEALRLAAEGLVHAAGAHLLDPTGEYNTGSAAELLATGGEVVGFSAWREGLVLGPAATGAPCGESRSPELQEFPVHGHQHPRR